MSSGDFDRGAFPVWTMDVLRYNDLDTQGHVNNSATGIFFESGRNKLVRDHAGPLHNGPTLFVIVKNTIEFLAEIHFPGEVHVGTKVKSISKSSFVLEQLLYSGGQIAARAEAVCVQIDQQTRKAAPIEGEKRERLEKLMVV